MAMLFFALAWVGFVRVVVRTDWWQLCSVLYACSILFLTLAWGFPLGLSAILTLWMGGIATLHFWAMVRFADTGALWFLLLVLAFAIVHAPMFLF